MTNYKCNGHIPDPKDKIYIPFDKSKIIGVSNNSSQDVDLRPFSPSKFRHDQGQTESCVANSTTQAIFLKYVEKFGINNAFQFSRLDLYFGSRSEMTPPQNHIDAGTNICLAMDVLRRFGVCKEETWEFNPANINIASPILATREAFANKISGHFKIDSVGDQRINDIILNLQNKNPVVFGTIIGSNWFNYNFNGPAIGKPTDKQGGHAMCCLPNTKIITENGIKNIEDIIPNDQVLTRQGFNKVNITTENYIEEEIYQIHSQLSLMPLEVTSEHPILIHKGTKHKKYKQISEENFEFIEAKNVKKYNYVSTKIDDKILKNDISIEFARLLGYYIGDGNLKINHGKSGNFKSVHLRLTYHRQDKREIVDDLIKIVELEYPGTKYHIYECKKSNTNIIIFYNTDLGRRILDLCGGPKNKSAEKLLYIEKEKQLQVIYGWYKTDGTLDWLDSSKIFTAERNLVEELVFLLQRCRLTYSSQYKIPGKTIINKRSCNTKGLWSVSFHTQKLKDSMFYEEDRIYTRITKISTKQYAGYVYNLEVDKCHEFIANNLITHNCIVGWINNFFIVENSWGSDWAGGDGFALVEPAVIADGDLTSDLWVMATEFDSFWDLNKENNS